MFDSDKLTVENRAVSPVIGVILMVAITVILAAVIGAFVLEIGDNQETAPNASFSSEERVTYVKAGTGANPQGNITTVSISHTGGGALDISQTQITAEGNETVWGFVEGPEASVKHDSGPPVRPQPNVCSVAGGKSSSWTSGESMSVVAYMGEPQGNVNEQTGEPRVPSDENFPGWTGLDDDFNSGCQDKLEIGFAIFQGQTNDKPAVEIDPRISKRTFIDGFAFHNVLDSGEEVTVVWTASSGGKTQALYKYTVQQDSPDFGDY